MVVWTGSQEDLTAKFKDYTLRVECIDFNSWWFRVYFKEKVIADSCFTNEYLKSQYKAKLKAIHYATKHKNK